MRTLIRIFAALAVWLSTPTFAVGQDSVAWYNSDKADPLTDEVNRSSCIHTGKAPTIILMCADFDTDEAGFVLSIAVGEGRRLSREYPALRIDSNPHIPSPGNARGISESTAKIWLAQPRPLDGDWGAVTDGVVAQMARGRELMVRLYLANGGYEDLIFPLAGACAELAGQLPQGDKLDCANAAPPPQSP